MYGASSRSRGSIGTGSRPPSWRSAPATGGTGGAYRRIPSDAIHASFAAISPSGLPRDLFRDAGDVDTWIAQSVALCREGLAFLFELPENERSFLDGALDRGEVNANLLGVEREAVMEDYLATNTVVAEELEELRQLAPPSLWPILGAQQKQMQAFLDQIDSELGGIDSYARSHLKLTDETIAQLRSTYLSPA